MVNYMSTIHTGIQVQEQGKKRDLRKEIYEGRIGGDTKPNNSRSLCKADQ